MTSFYQIILCTYKIGYWRLLEEHISFETSYVFHYNKPQTNKTFLCLSLCVRKLSLHKIKFNQEILTTVLTKMNQLRPWLHGYVFTWKKQGIVVVSPPVYTKTMKTIMKTQTFESEIQTPKWIDLKTQRNENGTTWKRIRVTGALISICCAVLFYQTTYSFCEIQHFVR